MRYRFLRYPGGKAKAVTLSYDDGCVTDKRFSDVITKAGLKCTFNICSNSSLSDEEIKEYREKELMLAQNEVSSKINTLKINNIYDILVEGCNEEYYYGRNYEMIPEVDGNVFFESDNEIAVGSIVKVKITDCTDYDLIGVVIYESCE